MLLNDFETILGSGLLDNLIGTDWSLVNPSDLPQKVIEVQESVHKTLVRQWRAARNAVAFRTRTVDGLKDGGR